MIIPEEHKEKPLAHSCNFGRAKGFLAKLSASGL